MSNDELKENWQKYALETIDGVVLPLKNHYVMCWGWVSEYGGLLFDTGGEQGATAHVFKVEGDNLVSVNPENPEETNVVGKLVYLGE